VGSVLCGYLLLTHLSNALSLGAIIIIVVINFAIAPAQGAVSLAALLATIMVLFGHYQDFWIPLSVLVILAAIVQWIHSGVMGTVVEWSWNTQRQTMELLSDTRERRGELASMFISLTEATRRNERTRHELAIARTQAEEARHIKALFAANISHELRTPLNLITGFSEMMVHTPEVYGDFRWPPSLRADLRGIYDSACHLMGMINDILDLSRIDADRLPLRLEACELEDLLQEASRTVSGLIKGKPVNIVMLPLPEMPTILVDRARIRQVIINLLNNAVRFTDEGTITISTMLQEDTYSISVRDPGLGIPEDQLAAIFEEFGQAKGAITSNRGGVGLGLAICRQFVHLHGGSIRAESTLGEGSTFTFEFPLPGRGTPASHLSYYAPEGWSPAIPENPMGRTALVLAPDAESARAMARIIPGYRCIPIADITALPEAIASEHPDGIILINDPLVPTLPGARDIWTAAARRDLPIVHCEIPLSRVMTDQLGIARYLTKPVQQADLLSAIKQRQQPPESFLIVDDDAGFVSLIQRMLQTTYPQATVRKAYTLAEAEQYLTSGAYDVLLLDVILPDGSGLTLIKDLQERGGLGAVHIIITSGSSYPEEMSRLRPSRVELLRAGGFHDTQTGRYISALLQVHPPDYTRPAPAGQPPAFVVASPAF